MDCCKHFFCDFLKIQVTNYGSFEEMKKGTSAIHGATFFFYQKGHGAQKKGHGVMKKGHGAQKKGHDVMKKGMAPHHSIFL
jgi:hypothetical protein